MEYLFYKATEGSMYKSKVTLHLDKSFPHDFDLSDEVQSLDFSFLYVLSGGFNIQIVSIVTSNRQYYQLTLIFRSSGQSNRFHLEPLVTVEESSRHPIRPTHPRTLPRGLPQFKHCKKTLLS